MSTGQVNILVECECGAPQYSPSHGPGGHTFKPLIDVGTLRDDQELIRGNRPGRYAIHEHRAFIVPAPAASTDFAIVVPSNARWRIKAFTAQLVTSAVVNNRIPHLVIKDPNGLVLFNFPGINNQPAGQTWAYSAGVSIVAVSNDNTTTFVLPYDTIMMPQWTLATLTTALQAGDQWGPMALLIEEWLQY